MRAIHRWSGIALALLGGGVAVSAGACSQEEAANLDGPDATAASVPTPDPSARPYDFTHSRIMSPGGDRYEGLGPHVVRAHPLPPERADWSFEVSGPVNGGVGMYVSSASGTPQCTDMLYVPVNGGGTNFYAFTNLYSSCTSADAGKDGSGKFICSPSANPAPSGHCPKLVFSVALTGNMNRNSVALSVDGTKAYVATDAGKLYSIVTSTGVATQLLDTGGGKFLGSTPWLDYGTNNIYIAAEFASSIRLYKLSSAGSVIATLDIGGDGIESGVLAYNGFVYLGSTSGRLYKVTDGATTLALVNDGTWPLVLTSEDWNIDAGAGDAALPDAAYAASSAVPVGGKAIYGTPSIDGGNNLLFVNVNNVMWSVTLPGGVKSSVEMGWANGFEAHGGDAACYSSPFLYSDANTKQAVFIAHGKNQSDTGANEFGPRMHRRIYNNDGTFDMATLTSSGIGSGTDLTYPRSSPLVFQPAAGGAVYAYVGDNTGVLNRFTYTDTNAFTAQAKFTIPSNPQSIDSPIVIDTTNGNIYFGSNNARVYQISQSSLQ